MSSPDSPASRPSGFRQGAQKTRTVVMTIAASAAPAAALVTDQRISYHGGKEMDPNIHFIMVIQIAQLSVTVLTGGRQNGLPAILARAATPTWAYDQLRQLTADTDRASEDPLVLAILFLYGKEAETV